MKEKQVLARLNIGKYGRKWRTKSGKELRRARFPANTGIKTTEIKERTPRSLTQNTCVFSELIKCIEENRGENARLVHQLEDNHQKIRSIHRYIVERITNLESWLDEEFQSLSESDEEFRN